MPHRSPPLTAATVLLAWGIAGCGLLIAPKELNQLSPAAFHDAIEDTGTFLVDVHVPEQPHLAGTDAVIHYREVGENLDRFPKQLDEPVYLYCLTGHMVNVAARTLLDEGHTKLYNLDGGTKAWEDAGYGYE